MKKTLLFLVLLFCFTHIKAQSSTNDSIFFRGLYVYDGFSEELLENVRVSVLEADSITVLNDSLNGGFEMSEINGQLKRDYTPLWGFAPRRNIYILRVTAPGYAPQLRRIEVPEKRLGLSVCNYTPEPFYMWHQMNYDLGEATVKGTQIKMVMRGDTLVYNAAAFQLAEGSMLDNLVRALPGVKLEDGGRITVNGEYVSSLLINGRDFFKGDPQIALANLPAYTVNKIKVYKKAPRGRENQERSEAERKKDPLVMDVNLKREYAQGWIANVEAGGGSRLGDGFDPVWMGRLFALRYTNHSSLGIYANVNNMDDYQAPGSKGEWKRADPGQGRRTTKMGGIDFSVDGKDSGIRFNTTLQAMRQDITSEQHTSAEDYLPAAPSVFRSSRSASRTGTTDLKWAANTLFPNFPTKKAHLGFVTFSPSVYYTRSTADATSLSSQWQHATQAPAYTATPDTLYDRLLRSTSERTAWGGRADLNFYLSLPWIRTNFNIQGYATLNHRKHTSLTGDRIRYADPTSEGLAQLRSERTPEMDYSHHVLTSLDKSIWLHGRTAATQFLLMYQFDQTFRSGHRDLSENDNWQSDDLTPSAGAPEEWAIDQANSFHTTRMERQHNLQADIYNLPIEPLTICLAADLNFYDRRIHDLRGGADRTYARKSFTWEPEVELKWWNKTFDTGIRYQHQQKLPDIFYLLNVRDDSDPLYVSLGNAQLRKAQIHAVRAYFKYKTQEHRRLLNVNARYNKSDRLVALARFYDLATGVTTTRPENIDGNWDAALSIAYTQGLGKDDRWTLQGEAKGSFLHSVDFATDNPSATLPDRVAVDNLSIDAMLRADYRFEKWTAGAKATVRHTRLTGGGPAFTPFHYTDAAMGLTLTAPLPGGIDLETDVMAYLRRGYADASMNTTDWVWNASLSKAFGKRKQWLLRAVGFDILQQLSNIRRTVNAQGRTETWYNTTPAYASLHLTYRFDMKPKKQAGKR